MFQLLLFASLFFTHKVQYPLCYINFLKNFVIRNHYHTCHRVFRLWIFWKTSSSGSKRALMEAWNGARPLTKSAHWEIQSESLSNFYGWTWARYLERHKWLGNLKTILQVKYQKNLVKQTLSKYQANLLVQWHLSL